MMAQSVVRSKYIQPEHMAQICSVLGVKEEDVGKLTADDVIKLLCVAVANIHGHQLKKDDEDEC